MDEKLGKSRPAHRHQTRRNNETIQPSRNPDGPPPDTEDAMRRISLLQRFPKTLGAHPQHPRRRLPSGALRRPEIPGTRPGRPGAPQPGTREFLKNSINFDKFTGFFDKFLRGIIEITIYNTIRYFQILAHHTQIRRQKSFSAAPAFARNCPHSPQAGAPYSAPAKASPASRRPSFRRVVSFSPSMW